MQVERLVEIAEKVSELIDDERCGCGCLLLTKSIYSDNIFIKEVLVCSNNECNNSKLTE